MKDTPKMRSLVAKGKRGILKTLFSRLGLITLLLLIQFALLFSVFNWFATFIPHYFGSTLVFNALMAILIINSRADATAKVTWLIVIMVLPVFGALLYLYTRSDFGHRALKRRAASIARETRFDLRQEPEVLRQLEQVQPGAAALSRYIGRCGCHPLWRNTSVTYYSSGEEKFEALLEAVRSARSFIFLEYFIVAEGKMWDQLLDVLREKAQAGVDVRVMIDGTCEFTTLPHDFPKLMKALGIQCKLFAPARPFVSTHYNYRDHRKIAVIDGQISFTGGVNLADEYINEVEFFGHWKDVAIRLDGEATRSFTLMFLQMWAMDGTPVNISGFLKHPVTKQKNSAGFVLPYGDCPLDGNKVGERVYMDILYRAERYVHIMTPYLILDGQMENALKYAAERGVDVHLILPGIPDKKYAFWLARTHYASLISAGVKISEYTPGFVHAKVFVADDREAVVGSINLDYRSLYHHFECAAYLNSVDCIADIEEDYQQTLSHCTRMTEKRLSTIPWYQRLAGAALKALAPLM
ncbi:MAG: cardiolipin synthase [Clostridia bacterium]|nr:cardiolipin synthase [Clostridia bacterium]